MSIVHARLDAKTEELLRRVKQSRGWTDSEAVRAGLRLLEAELTEVEAPRVIGVGEFSSGVSDLGSNQRHLRGFGKSR